MSPVFQERKNDTQLTSQVHTFTLSLGQESPSSPGFLVESGTALVTALTTSVVLTLTARFLATKTGKHT
jgi:hypothetical protein